MQSFIVTSMQRYPSMYKSPADVLSHLFCVNGNSLDLYRKLKLNANYSCKEGYVFPEPTPFTYLYPWSETERYQPFRKYVGCKDVGFKEAVDYFLACLKITPKEVAKEWVDNIDLISSVLSEDITLPVYDKDDVEGFIKSLGNGKTTLDHPMDGTVLEPNSSVKKVWFLDAQWSDLPQEIEDEVRQLWSDYELGNDNYIAEREVNEGLFEEYPKIYLWCKYKGIPENETVIIHWWW